MRTTIDHDEQLSEDGTPRFDIETAEDLSLAERRISALRTATRGEAEERELQALTEAVRRWHARHAHATGRKE